MSRTELVRKYVDYHGLHFIKGSAEDISVLMPYFIMDCGYQYYCHDIQQMKLRFQLKNMRSKWSESYLAFKDNYEKPYNNDESILIGEMMDAMHDVLANDLMVLQVSVMRLFEKDFTFEQQKVLSSVFMTNKLAVIAQNTWYRMFRRENHDINGVLEWSRGFSDVYMRSLGKKECSVEETKVDGLTRCANILIDKLTRWLINENGKEE